MTVASTQRKLTIWKYDFELEQTSFPESLLFARNTTFPTLEIHGTVFTLGFGEEAERVVAPPLLAGRLSSDIQVCYELRCSPRPLLLQSVLTQRHCASSVCWLESNRNTTVDGRRREAYGAERKKTFDLIRQATTIQRRVRESAASTA